MPRSRQWSAKQRIAAFSSRRPPYPSEGFPASATRAGALSLTLRIGRPVCINAKAPAGIGGLRFPGVGPRRGCGSALLFEHRASLAVLLEAQLAFGVASL